MSARALDRIVTGLKDQAKEETLVTQVKVLFGQQLCQSAWVANR